MKHNPKFIYPKSTRSSVDGHRHYDLGEAKLPSVTTILSATQPPKKMKALAAWKLRVGENEAARIVDNSATRGTAMHRIIESYLTGQYHLDLTDVGRNAHNMAQTIIDTQTQTSCKSRDARGFVWPGTGVSPTHESPALTAREVRLPGSLQQSACSL